MCNILAVSKI